MTAELSEPWNFSNDWGPSQFFSLRFCSWQWEINRGSREQDVSFQDTDHTFPPTVLCCPCFLWRFSVCIAGINWWTARQRFHHPTPPLYKCGLFVTHHNHFQATGLLKSTHSQPHTCRAESLWLVYSCIRIYECMCVCVWECVWLMQLKSARNS